MHYMAEVVGSLDPREDAAAQLDGSRVRFPAHPVNRGRICFIRCGAQVGCPYPLYVPIFKEGLPQDNVTQVKSSNDAVLKWYPSMEVHEFLTLLNGTQALCTTFL